MFSRALFLWLIGAAAVLVLGAVLERAPPRPGEPLVLRWLRIVPEVPLRSSVAAALLLGAQGGCRFGGNPGRRLDDGGKSL